MHDDQLRQLTIRFITERYVSSRLFRVIFNGLMQNKIDFKQISLLTDNDLCQIADEVIHCGWNDSWRAHPDRSKQP